MGDSAARSGEGLQLSNVMHIPIRESTPECLENTFVMSLLKEILQLL
jgi:hypothetical protein